MTVLPTGAEQHPVGSVIWLPLMLGVRSDTGRDAIAATVAAVARAAKRPVRCWT
jgi:hypothetical protein